MVCKDLYEARWPMVSSLNFGSSGLGSSPDWEHGVFSCMGTRHFTLPVPLSSPRCINGFQLI